MKMTFMQRLRRAMTFVGILLVWAGVAWATYALSRVVNARYAEIVVKDVVINIADSTSAGNLITTEMVKQMLSKERIKYQDVTLGKIPYTLIEKTIGKNGFVKDVKAYASARGVLHIDVWQRTALVRLMVDGYNNYLTKDGFIFPAPSTTALHTGVVTGKYRPLFSSSYIGNIEEYTKREMEKLENEIESLEREKLPIYHREKLNNEDKSEMRRRYISPSPFEPDEVFAARVYKLRMENHKLRTKYAYRQRVIDSELRSIELKQERLRSKQKKLLNYCDDLHNLIIFVELLERDEFWRSEIVQISLSEGHNDMMRLSLSLRSANFKVDFGALTSPRPTNVVITDNFRKMSLESKRVERKTGGISSAEVAKSIDNRLEKLRDFYDNTLPRVGWDRYKRVSIEFDGQVVCRK